MLLTLSASAAYSATYYVAKTGDNLNNNCTEAQNQATPKLTITAGMACLTAAGDILIVKAGTYNENLIINVPNGTDSAYTTIRAATGETVWLRPLSYYSSTDLRHRTIRMNSGGQHHIKVERINVDLSGLPADGQHSTEGLHTQGIANSSTNSHHLIFDGMEIKHSRGDASHIRMVYATTFRNMYIHSVGTTVADVSPANNIYFQANPPGTEGNIVEDSILADNNDTEDGYGISMLDANNAIVRNTVIEDISTQGCLVVRNASNNVLLYNNICINSYSGFQIYTTTTNTRVYNNTIYDMNSPTHGGCIVAQQGGGTAQPVTSAMANLIKNNICWQLGNNSTSLHIAGNHYTDPQFTNAAARVLTLQSGSSAIDAGIPVALVPDDFVGTPRPQPSGGSYDRGAYEFTTQQTGTDHTILKTNFTMTQNGNLDEFQNANVINMSGGSGNSTTVRMLWDTTNLYIGIKTNDPELIATATTNDGSDLFEDDSIEFLFDTLNDSGASLDSDDYKITVTAAEIRRDSVGGDPVAWNGPYTYDAVLDGTLNNGVNDTSYSIEIRLPWSSVGLTPQVTTPYGMNFMVNDKDTATGRTTYTWNGSISTVSDALNVSLSNTLAGAPTSDTVEPSVPTNLVANAISSSAITVTWSASTDNSGTVVGYRVERCQGASCSNWAQVATPTGTSFGDTGLIYGTVYRYRVRAVDATPNLSPYSSPAEATTNDIDTSAFLVAHYPFDGTANSSTGSHNATNVGTPTYTSGQLLQAVSLNGTSSALSVAHDTALSFTSDMTVSFWLYADTLPTSGQTKKIIQKESGLTSSAPYVVDLVNTSGTTRLVWYHHTNLGDFSTVLTFSGYTVPQDTWAHISFVRKNTPKTVSLYVNGAFVESKTWTTDNPASNTGTVAIGYNALASSQFLHGMLDDLRLYSMALNEDDALLLAQLSELQPPFFADDPSGLTAPGSSTVVFASVPTGLPVSGSSAMDFAGPPTNLSGWSLLFTQVDAAPHDCSNTYIGISPMGGANHLVDDFGGGTALDTSQFPVTMVLDNFNRANEDPIAGIWLNGVTGVGACQLLNQMLSRSSGTFNCYVNAQYGGSQEVFATFPNITSHNPLTNINIYACLDPATIGTSDVTGYRLRIQKQDLLDRLILERVMTTTIVPIGTFFEREMVNGDSLGLRILAGGIISVWVNAESTAASTTASFAGLPSSLGLQ
jgi:hypothetical protein